METWCVLNKSNKQILSKIKESKSFKIPINDIGYLKPLTYFDIGEDRIINHLMIWRNNNLDAYLSDDLATFDGTRTWLSKYVLDNPHKILFLACSSDGIPFGHMGLADGLNADTLIEMDNIVRGELNCKDGGMILALYELISWVFIMTNIEQVYLRVFPDNKRAIKMYENLKFEKKDRHVDCFSYMELSRDDHFGNYNNIMRIS